MTTARKENQSFDKLRTSVLEELVISCAVFEALRSAASHAHPREACGILLGEGVRIDEFVETDNVHPAPESHFEIDPQALIDAHRSERAGGLQIQGYFHSHPSGPAQPSVTDQKMAARDGKIWAIVGENEMKLWRDAPGGFQPLSYTVANE